ncbi:hypothetical protein C0989_000526, partial [Termitomyces sp. Mn162]
MVNHLQQRRLIPSYHLSSGGGIGGLALAAFICYHSNDIAVDIYETKNEISSIGAGIAIWKRTWQTLQDIGLEDEVIKRNLPLPKEGEAIGPIFRKADQLTAGIDFHNHMMPYGPLAIPRPILLDMLKSRLSSLCAIYTSTHVTSYEEASEGGILIKMKDGSTQTADILIGCDGVHSAIRATLFKNLAKVDTSQGYEKFCEPKWSGSIAYRGVADRNKLRQKNPKNPALDQPRIHVVTHPFGDIVNLVCFYNEENGFGKLYTDPWVDNVPVDQVVGHYEDWEPALVEVVSGVGGGQAIEDAHILGRLLAHNKTSRANLSKVLEIYQEVRLPLAKTAAERSRSNGLLYDFIHPDFPLSSTATVEDLMPIGQAVGETFAWLGKGGCDDDWK